MFCRRLLSTLCSFSADSAGQLNVLGHDGDALSVDGTQVGVFKETNKVSLASFLKSHHSGTLETQIGLEILSDFSHKTLEGQLADQQLGGFLVTTDLTKSDCTRPVTMRLFDSTSSRSTLTSCLCGELFAWSFPSSRFTSGLLCTSHFRTSIRSDRINAVGCSKVRFIRGALCSDWFKCERYDWLIK